MRDIPLFGGRVAIVDDEDYERLAAMRWRARRRPRTTYAMSGWRPEVLMHRVVLGFGPGDPQVDHVNGDGLDNRRANLRPATQAQQNANQQKTRGTSRFKGVYWDRRDARWAAGIRIGGRRRHLGNFTDEEDAARAYDAAAREHFGEFAKTNFP